MAQGTHTVGNTVYLLTGASSGIGAAILALLLARPRVTVLALHRPTTPFPARDYTIPLSDVTHATSALIAAHYMAAMTAAAVHEMAGGWRATHGIARIDIIIAAAGATDQMRAALVTPWADVVNAAAINLGGPLMLVQGLRGLLGLGADDDQKDKTSTSSPEEISPDRQAKGHRGSVFAFLSSSVASMGQPEPAEAPGFAYGASKAAANYLVARLHVECAAAQLTSVAIHPGWVRTRMGAAAARDWGVPEDYPPLSAHESAVGVLSVIDGATRDTLGGKFVAWNGEELKW